VLAARRVERLVLVKEAMLIVGRELGVSNADMARLLRLDTSVVSRRYESGKAKMEESQEARRLAKRLRGDLAGKE
jgi:ribosome-binding protein aMBF1 (putative translation factor)